MNDPVQAQLEAYNARDAEAFMNCYTEDVVVEDGAGNLRLQGWAAMKERYASAFAAEPEVRCEIITRIRHGEYAVDYEFLTGYQDGSTRRAVAIYRLREGLICHVRFL